MRPSRPFIEALPSLKNITHAFLQNAKQNDSTLFLISEYVIMLINYLHYCIYICIYILIHSELSRVIVFIRPLPVLKTKTTIKNRIFLLIRICPWRPPNLTFSSVIRNIGVSSGFTDERRRNLVSYKNNSKFIVTVIIIIIIIIIIVSNNINGNIVI